MDGTSVSIPVPGEVKAFGKHVRVSTLESLPSESLSAYCTPTRQVIDAACLSGEVRARHRKPGDRISPLGLGGSRKLKDYFCDLGIPPEERDEKMLICLDDEILWIVGHAVSNQAAVSGTTTHAVEIEVTDAAE